MAATGTPSAMTPVAQPVQRLEPAVAPDSARMTPPVESARPAVAPRVPPLVVRCLGPMMALCGGQPVDPRAWKRRRSKSLLAYLALRRQYSASHMEIEEAFQLDGASDRAISDIIRHDVDALNKALNATAGLAGAIYAVSEKSIVRLVSEHVQEVDVLVYNRHLKDGLLARLREDAAAEVAALSAAATLYRSPLLAGETGQSWPGEGLRDDYRRKQAHRLLRLAVLAAQAGQVDEVFTRFDALEHLLATDDSESLSALSLHDHVSQIAGAIDDLLAACERLGPSAALRDRLGAIRRAFEVRV